ncbi:hypothetical protein LL912_11645 [Niabella sp. CC-SYL272]|uniref:hypothetical protein n=1 Tax=Niabella agricola TaxID=2891571 RepID=UPI001F268C2A|nr:hypothetical protein [Niabella agricola]MCF3109429.1 hypothetical protein [Niabella agricola]
MTYLQKIQRLYHLEPNDHSGFADAELAALEQQLGTALPVPLKNYYTALGKQEQVNHSYNRLLPPGKEMDFSADGYLVFYEENQAVCCWGIQKEDLAQDNPPVWGNYGTETAPDWHQEAGTTEDFFLLMAVYNGTMGGLPYNANCLGTVDPAMVRFIEARYTLVPAISWERQRVYTDDFYEVLSLSFAEAGHCNALFAGTSDAQRFGRLLDAIDVEWSYIADEE